MTRIVSIAALALLIVGGAAVHGAATYRWAALAPAPELANKLHAYAIQLGDFQSEVVPSDFDIKEKSSVTCRRYISMAQNLGVMVSVTTGPPGAVATHTPDVCYPSSGYKIVTPMKRESVPLSNGGTATFYVADFEKRTATKTDRQRVRWAWAIPGGTWETPDRPRFTYLNQPELVKLYVVTQFPPIENGERAADDTPAVRSFVSAAFAQYADVIVGR